ncbi:hypothetical protein V8E36_002964 [Tilletia maclaganii]
MRIQPFLRASSHHQKARSTAFSPFLVLVLVLFLFFSALPLASAHPAEQTLVQRGNIPVKATLGSADGTLNPCQLEIPNCLSNFCAETIGNDKQQCLCDGKRRLEPGVRGHVGVMVTVPSSASSSASGMALRRSPFVRLRAC